MAHISPGESTIRLLLIMVTATFSLASQAHDPEPNGVCLTEEGYKNISYASQKDLADLKETMKEEFERMKEHQTRLEEIIRSMADSISKLSTRASPLCNDLSITESPIPASTQIYEDNPLYEEFYEAAGDGNITFINTQLENGKIYSNSKNSSNISNRKLLTWRNGYEGYTALHEAAERGHIEVVMALLEAGASPNAKSSHGWTPVHIAAGASGEIHTAVLKAILQPQYQANVNQKCDKGSTPVQWAAIHGNAGSIEVLVAHGADVNIVDNTGVSPLIATAYKDRVDAVEALINAGARVEDADDSGTTALHTAAVVNAPSVVRLLLLNGADKSQRNEQGQTPAEAARIRGNNEIAELIENWQYVPLQPLLMAPLM